MKTGKVYGVSGKEIVTMESFHPGLLLREELEARRISQKEFAEKLGWRPSHFNELLRGKRHFSALLALKIESLLKIDAGTWMRLQVQFDLDLARKQLKAA